MVLGPVLILLSSPSIGLWRLYTPYSLIAVRSEIYLFSMDSLLRYRDTLRSEMLTFHTSIKFEFIYSRGILSMRLDQRCNIP
ncbi:hypothetical protein F4860DRAFT_437869 [Xylaria cubensis]|nr:hypothetical protein F4860DRAFT_437869 [Xylaria cubensis]